MKTISDLTTATLAMFGGGAHLTPELGDSVAEFVRAHAAPHCIFWWSDGVLHTEMTWGHSATFPVHEDTGYATPMNALLAASNWAVTHGAVTHEVRPVDTTNRKVPTSGQLNKCDEPESTDDCACTTEHRPCDKHRSVS